MSHVCVQVASSSIARLHLRAICRPAHKRRQEEQRPCLSKQIMMSTGQASSQRQVLSPTKWNQAKATAALRKPQPERPVNSASHFVPLLDWQQDRAPSQALNVQMALKAEQTSHAQQGSNLPRQDVLVANNAHAASDASISSSDEEYDPRSKHRRRSAAPSQRKA